jgi:hypothetical protein
MAATVTRVSCSVARCRSKAFEQFLQGFEADLIRVGQHLPER